MDENTHVEILTIAESLATKYDQTYIKDVLNNLYNNADSLNYIRKRLYKTHQTAPVLNKILEEYQTSKHNLDVYLSNLDKEVHDQIMYKFTS